MFSNGPGDHGSVSFRVPFIGQIDLFINYLYSICPSAKKKKNKQKEKTIQKQLQEKCKYKRTINAIP